MTLDSQQETIAFLSAPATCRTAGEATIIETHISLIVLSGERAFKLKRAVKLPYVDFSTPDLRLAACEKEVELNSRTAPGLYLGARRITREANSRLAFDGDGELVDGVVEMVRFDQSHLLDKMAVAGTLTPTLMTQVAHMVARFHKDAPTLHTGSGASNIAAVLDINDAGFATSQVFGRDDVRSLSKAFRLELSRYDGLLDERESAGKIRRCHGDLHLRNICLLEGEPRLFDCIEFNDKIATIDILYDLAFLLMDLWHRGLFALANLVVNCYLDEAGDEEHGFKLLPFFMAVRAAVRAHVTATQIQEGGGRTDGLVAEARSYFDLARTLLRAVPPTLTAIGGLSGSGKTTVAEVLACRIGAPPGARIIESDRIRKAMYGVAVETRLPASAYLPEVSHKVYAEMVRRARFIASQGGSVVANAVYDRAPERGRIEAAAHDAKIPFTGIWLEADPALLRQRVGTRRKGASDATVDVLSQQLQSRVDASSWHKVDASRPPGDVAAEIVRHVALQSAG